MHAFLTEGNNDRGNQVGLLSVSDLHSVSNLYCMGVCKRLKIRSHAASELESGHSRYCMNKIGAGICTVRTLIVPTIELVQTSKE